MLNFQSFTACIGTTERMYHLVLEGQVERSYTEFQSQSQKSRSRILSLSSYLGIKVDLVITDQEALQGFAIAFDTRNQETVSMSLKALFVADAYVLNAGGKTSNAATACSSSGGNTRRGGNSRFYLHEGTSWGDRRPF